jgi:hypothetical protein
MPDLTDHSLASGKLIEVNLLAVLRSLLLIELGCEDSAATRANRQASLRCLGTFQRNVGPAHGLLREGSSAFGRPVSFQMREIGIPDRPLEFRASDAFAELGDHRAPPAAHGGSQPSRIGGHDCHDETSMIMRDQTAAWLCRALSARGDDQRDQNARRLAAEGLANCFGRVCRSPQNSTPANTTNIVTTKTVTSNESVGMRLISP